MNETQRGIAGMLLTVMLVASSVVAVRVAYGANDNPYSVHVDFPRAGQGLLVGSDVSLRGVPIGEVGAIDLVDQHVSVRLDLNNEDFLIPTDATATIRPKTLFGEKEIDLVFDPLSPGPFVPDEGRLPATAGLVGTEVEGLVDSTTVLIDRIDSDQLATVIFELSEAVEGQGDNIRAQFDSGVRLSALLADTIDAQLVAIEGGADFTGHLADLGDDLNALNAELNRGLPIINAARPDFERFLSTIPPFARELARVLSVSRPNIHKMLDEGDNVMRVLLARQPELAETLEGLGNYFFVFANGVGDEVFEDGSRFVYFVAFAAEKDVNDLVCSLLGASPVPDFAEILSSVQGASGVDCSEVSATPAGSATSATATGGTPTLPDSGQRLLDQVGLDIATADQPVITDVNDLVTSWAGGDSGG